MEVDVNFLIKALTEQRDAAMSTVAGLQARIWALEAENTRLLGLVNVRKPDDPA